jgi:hypothetical protein
MEERGRERRRREEEGGGGGRERITLRSRHLPIRHKPPLLVTRVESLPLSWKGRKREMREEREGRRGGKEGREGGKRRRREEGGVPCNLAISLYDINLLSLLHG